MTGALTFAAVSRGNVDGISARKLTAGRVKLFSFAARNTFCRHHQRDHARFYEIKIFERISGVAIVGLLKKHGPP